MYRVIDKLKHVGDTLGPQKQSKNSVLGRGKEISSVAGVSQFIDQLKFSLPKLIYLNRLPQ
jgi:hypothetical protein